MFWEWGMELVLHSNLQSILQMLTAILYYIHLYATERQILSPSSWKACTNSVLYRYTYLRSKWRSKQNQIISIRKHQQWERKLTKRKENVLCWLEWEETLSYFSSTLCLHIFFAYKWVKFICAPRSYAKWKGIRKLF